MDSTEVGEKELGKNELEKEKNLLLSARQILVCNWIIKKVMSGHNIISRFNETNSWLYDGLRKTRCFVRAGIVPSVGI